MSIDAIDDDSRLEFGYFEPIQRASSWNGRAVDMNGGTVLAFPNMSYTKHDYRLAGGRVESGKLDFEMWVDQKDRIEYGGKVTGTLHFGPKEKKEKDSSSKQNPPAPKPSKG